MRNDENELETAGLKFFGHISASISHEIKNVLAIINENAGLLEDLLLMAEKSGDLPRERLHRISSIIRKQVYRGDDIVKGMNRFSHSIDLPIEVVDLFDMATFVVTLWDRKIKGKKVLVDIQPPSRPVTAKTHRFGVQQVFWGCFDFLLQTAAAGSTIEIRMGFEEETVRIEGAIIGTQPLNDVSFPWPLVTPFLHPMAAEIELSQETGSFRLRLPRQ